MKLWTILAAALLLGACASAGYSGSDLRPGEARLDDVLRAMGQPALRWQSADGSQQLAYPRGPWGVHTYMVHLGPDGRLKQIENVMDPDAFARIKPGMSKEEVLRALGPPYPGWTAYFPARDELVWEWRYCDPWSEAARFDVLFDGSKGTVRSTQSQTEALRGLCEEGMCFCGR
jgi:Small protein A (tmRNA-binding)